MRSKRKPVIQELGPTGPWLVDLLDGRGDQTVNWSQDHDLCGDIFACSCGARFSWSKGMDVGHACKHIALACLAALRIVDEI
jgi:hypothetical protein